MKLIRKPIFKAPSGYWWAYSATRPNRVYSLGTRDGAKAQAKYDQQIRAQAKYDQQIRDVRRHMAEGKK